LIDPELINSFLKAHSFYNELYYFEEIPSTNDFAKKEECRSNAVVLTSFQTSGKGRLGRKWLSVPNENLTFSLKLKLNISPDLNRYVIFYVSRIIFDTLQQFIKKDNVGTAPLSIKWPNDILWNNRKLCGILTESILKTSEYVIGIGLNVNQLNFAPEIEAVSISDITGKQHDLNGLIVQLLTDLKNNIHLLESQNHKQLFNLWLNSTNITGKRCSFSMGNESLKYGFINSLNEDGTISIETNGEIISYNSGDIKLMDY